MALLYENYEITLLVHILKCMFKEIRCIFFNVQSYDYKFLLIKALK